MRAGQLAVVLPYWFDRPAGEALDIAAAAERLGYAELWLGEMATFDAFALAGAVAQTTRRIPLTVGPLAAAVRSPVALAMGIASVAALAGRPAHLALGASSPAIVEGWHDRAFARAAARTRETIAALRPLLAGQRGDFTGQVVRTRGFRLRLDAAATTLTVAAFGPRMLAVAAELADRAVVNLLLPEQIRALRRQLEALAAAAGRPCPPLCAWVPAALDPDSAAFSQMAEQLTVYLAPPGYGEMFIAAGYRDLVLRARAGAPRAAQARAVPRRLREQLGLLGDRAALLARAADFHAAGADRLAIVPITAHDHGGARLLAALAR